MAGEGETNEELELEQQLELQLEEQRESLSLVKYALASDASNSELILVQDELVLAIKEAEEELLHLKKARLLKAADSTLFKQEPGSIFDDVKTEQLHPSQVEVEPLESQEYSTRSKCRFRHTDGRWYNGYIVSLEDAKSARISFLTPTSENMLMCKFFLQQRCRFGNNCRLSHGLNIPISSLKQYIPITWQRSLIGSKILATSPDHSGLWKKAELISWDSNLEQAEVIFEADGTSATLGSDSISLSEHAEMSDSDTEEDGSDSVCSDELSSDKDDEIGSFENNQGIGFPNIISGVQTDTALFAKWENHTRGIASKMMASMGYKEGMGLGASGQGIIDPVSVKVLPKKQSLDHSFTVENKEKKVRKRSRGGKRKRDKKFAEAARAAKVEDEQHSVDVFDFINNQLAGQEVKPRKGSSDDSSINRRSLIAYEGEVKELRIRVEKYEEMAHRNRKDKKMFEAATRKLVEMRKELADAESAHASASNAVVSKEKEKKWLKF